MGMAGLGRKWGTDEPRDGVRERGSCPWKTEVGEALPPAGLAGLLSHPDAWHLRRPQAGAAGLARTEAWLLGALGLARHRLAVQRANVYSGGTAALAVGRGPHPTLPLAGTPSRLASHRR